MLNKPFCGSMFLFVCLFVCFLPCVLSLYSTGKIMFVFYMSYFVLFVLRILKDRHHCMWHARTAIYRYRFAASHCLSNYQQHENDSKKCYSAQRGFLFCMYLKSIFAMKICFWLLQLSVYYVCFLGAFQTLLCLLDNGANVNKANHSGWTPLHFACK
jgi:hypothetical protein